MSAVETIGLVLVAYAVGSIGHEVAHYAVAWAFHTDPAFRLTRGRFTVGLAVDHDGADPPDVADLLIGSAPLVLGLVVALATYREFGLAVPLWVVVGWVVFTFSGLPGDLQFRTVEE